MTIPTITPPSPTPVELARSFKSGDALPSKLKEACIEFEVLFVTKMLDSMRATVKRSGLIKRNMGERIFEERLYDKYAQKIAQTAHLGLAETLYESLTSRKRG